MKFTENERKSFEIQQQILASLLDQSSISNQVKHLINPCINFTILFEDSLEIFSFLKKMILFSCDVEEKDSSSDDSFDDYGASKP